MCIPAGSVKLMAARGNQHLGPSVQSVLFEPTDNELPSGIVISRAFLSLDQGQISVPVVNVETRDVWLPPRTVLVKLFCVIQQISSQLLTIEEDTDNGGHVAVIQSLSVEQNTLDLSHLSWPVLPPDQQHEGKA